MENEYPAITLVNQILGKSQSHLLGWNPEINSMQTAGPNHFFLALFHIYSVFIDVPIYLKLFYFASQPNNDTKKKAPCLKISTISHD